MEDVVRGLIVSVPMFLLMLSSLYFVSAIFNEWAHRHVMPIKDPRRRRSVLIVRGVMILILAAIILILAILRSLRPNAQI